MYEFIARNGLIAQNDSTITGSLTVTGTITATTLVAQTVTSSTSWITGSTKFGSTTSNTHQFTGSIYQSGSEAIFAGNVGIGTTSPNSILEIAASTPVFRIAASDNSQFHGIEFRQGAGFDAFIKQLPQTGEFRISNGRSAGWGGFTTFYTDTSERMRITSGGNVGIGTTSPTTTLHVRTDTGVLIRGASSDIDAILSFLPASGGRQYNFRNYGSSFGIQDVSADNIRMYFHFNGNVGIGDSGPSSRLHVYTNGTGSSYNGIGLDNGAQEHYWYLEDNFTSVYNIGSSAGKWKWSNSNGTHVTILSDGNVGIGTTSPLKSLQINATAPAIRLQENGSGGDKRLELSVSSSGVATIAANQSAQILTFETAGSERMRIAADGNVGIGTTNPDSKFKFGPSNGSQIRFDYAGTGDNYYDGVTHYFRNGNGVSNIMTLLSGGSVGIGTTSPGYLLDLNSSGPTTLRIKGASTGYTQGALLLQSATTDSPSSRGLGVYTFNEGTDATWFFGNGYSYGDNFVINRKTGSSYDPSAAAPGESSNWFLINNSGNVGIGTTNPAYPLDIVGFANSTSGFRVTDGTIDNRISWSSGNVGFFGTISNHAIAFHTNNTERIRITSGGNVGIGTTSAFTTGGTAKLSIVDSSVALSMGLSNSDMSYIRRNGTAIFQWQTSDGGNNGQIHLQPYGGNVGIGTTSPTAKLQVSGSTNVVNIIGSGSASATSVFSVDGNNGRLFEITDDLSDSVFSANTIAGLPVIEAFSDYTVRLGTYGGASGSTVNITGSNVGIGTNVPLAKLQVASGTGTTMLVGRASGNSSIKAGADADGGYLSLDSNGSATIINHYVTDNIWLVTGGGNVGIGTTAPGAKLQVYGNMQIYAGSSGNSDPLCFGGETGTSKKAIFLENFWMVYQGHDNEGHKFRSVAAGGGYTDDMVITGGGNVGIGTTSPGAKLEVSGNILATNFNSDNAVVNTADTYTGTAKITNIITLSQAEYDAIGSPSSSYLYVII